MEDETAAFLDSWDKLRLPDKFAKMLDCREPREVKLREAGGGRRVWDFEVVLDGEDHMYLERGWEEFARAHDLHLGNVLVFSYAGDATLAVKVFDDANTGSNDSINSSSNSSRAAEMGIDDVPASQFTVTLKKKKCQLGARQQQYLNSHGHVSPGSESSGDSGMKNSIIGSGSKNSSSTAEMEMDMDDAPTSQSTVMLRRQCHLGKKQKQYLNMPPEFKNAHGYEGRSKEVLRMPGNLKQNMLLAMIAVLLCTFSAATTARGHQLEDGWERIPNLNDTEVGKKEGPHNAWEPIPNLKDPDVQEIAWWAVVEHGRQAKDGLLLIERVVSGMEQTVSGTNWKLRIEATNRDGEECTYVAEVYDQLWTNTRRLTSFTPVHTTQGMCKPGVHPDPGPPNSWGTQIKPAKYVGLMVMLIVHL